MNAGLSSILIFLTPFTKKAIPTTNVIGNHRKISEKIQYSNETTPFLYLHRKKKPDSSEKLQKL